MATFYNSTITCGDFEFEVRTSWRKLAFHQKFVQRETADNSLISILTCIKRFNWKRILLNQWKIEISPTTPINHCEIMWKVLTQLFNLSISAFSNNFFSSRPFHVETQTSITLWKNVAAIWHEIFSSLRMQLYFYSKWFIFFLYTQFTQLSERESFSAA